jgi:hypothetical protein
MGLYFRYTFSESKAYISKRYPQNEKDIVFGFDDYRADFFISSGETEVIPLPVQASHTMNTALFYKARKRYIKLTGNFHTAFLDELETTGTLIFSTTAAFTWISPPITRSHTLSIYSWMSSTSPLHHLGTTWASGIISNSRNIIPGGAGWESD